MSGKFEKEIGLLAIRRLAEEVNYQIILFSLLGDNFWKRIDQTIFELLLADYPEKERCIVRFLFLGKRILRKESCLSEDEVNSLETMGILNREGDNICLNNIRLIPYMDLLIFCDFFFKDTELKTDHVWIGDDSIYLSKVIMTKKNKKVLEIGTGSGILSLVMAQRDNQVLAVDISERAVKLAKINAILNGMSDRVEVIHSDLFESVNDKFDLVVSNPPFLPISMDREYFFAGGGREGTEVIKKIITSVGAYLNTKGEVYILGGGFGIDEKIFLFNDLKEYFIKKRCDVNVFILKKNRALNELRHLKHELGIIEIPKHSGDMSRTF